MRLYLVQHGEAVDKTVDPQRPLSLRGAEDILKLAAFLERAGVRADRVLHSGKARAVRTAEILSASVTPGSEPAAHSALGPKDPVGPVLRELEASGQDAMLVGHMPFVAAAVNALLGAGTDRPAVAYRPGSLVCLERADDGGWSVAWMLRPELL